jgi:hypothetical protein
MFLPVKPVRELRFYVVSFWHYLTDRLGIGEQTIPPLPEIITARVALATGY